MSIQINVSKEEEEFNFFLKTIFHEKFLARSNTIIPIVPRSNIILKSLTKLKTIFKVEQKDNDITRDNYGPFSIKLFRNIFLHDI